MNGRTAGPSICTTRQSCAIEGTAGRQRVLPTGVFPGNGHKAADASIKTSPDLGIGELLMRHAIINSVLKFNVEPEHEDDNEHAFQAEQFAFDR